MSETKIPNEMTILGENIKPSKAFWLKISKLINRKNKVKLRDFLTRYKGENMAIFKNQGERQEYVLIDDRLHSSGSTHWSNELKEPLYYLGWFSTDYEDLYFGTTYVYSLCSGQVRRICRVDEVYNFDYDPLDILSVEGHDRIDNGDEFVIKI